MQLERLWLLILAMNLIMNIFKYQLHLLRAFILKLIMKLYLMLPGRPLVITLLFKTLRRKLNSKGHLSSITISKEMLFHMISLEASRVTSCQSYQEDQS